MRTHYYKNPLLTYPTIDVIAATVIAYRKNNNQVEKYDTTETISGIKILSNKSYVFILLKNPGLITQADRDEAQAIIQHIQSTVTMELLANKKVSKFTISIAKNLNEEVIPENSIGLVVYAPKIYESSKQRESTEEKIKNVMYSSVALGKVGDKVRINFTLITKKFIASINCFSVIGTDEKGNLIQFLTPKEEVGQSQILEGIIKTVGSSEYHHDAIVTGLNYVKIPKNNYLASFI